MSRMRFFSSAPVILLATIVLGACSDGSDKNFNPGPGYDFSAIDSAFEEFLDESVVFDGISVTLVDSVKGTTHEAAFGDHTLDIVVLLASTSKMPSVSLLMALQEDESLSYDVESAIDRYLPWDGVYGDRTTVQLVSNTSGIPGLSGIPDYGPHLCQYSADAISEQCAETLYTVEVPGTINPGLMFNYGGSQWQLSGAVAEQVTNSSWNQAFERYVGGPCDLEVFTYGNPLSDPSIFDGSPDSLIGKQNPNVEAGAISNMQDYAKILLMHLRGGRCGDNQVLSQESVDFMQIDRAGDLGQPYGMAWWIIPGDDETATIYWDPGLYGAISWLDVERGIGGYVGIDDYTLTDPGAVYALVLDTIIPLQQKAVDEARAAGP